MRQCEYHYADGRRCGNHVIPGSKFCLQHRRRMVTAGPGAFLLHCLAGFRQAAGSPARPVTVGSQLRYPGLYRDRHEVPVAAEALVFLPVAPGAEGGETATVCQLLLQLSTIMDLGGIRILYALAGRRGFLVRLGPSAGAGEPLSRFYDQLASAVQLAGGQLFVGGDQHFIIYRDQEAPAGYDALGGPAAVGDLVLVDASGCYHLPATELRVLALAELLLRVGTGKGRRSSPRDAGQLYVLAPVELYRLAVRFCRRWQVDCRASRFTASGRQQVLFQLLHPVRVPVNVVSYLADLPGCRVYVPAGDRDGSLLLVPWRHDFNGLAANFLGAFPDRTLVLLGAGGDEAGFSLTPTPVFFPLDELTDHYSQGLPAVGQRLQPDKRQLPRLAMSVQLVADSRRPPPAAVLLRDREIEWFRCLRRRLPPFVFSRGEIFAGAEHLLLLGAELPTGLLPFGQRFYRYDDGALFLPVGLKLLPAVPWLLLQSLLEVGADEYLFMTRNERLVLKRDDFLPLETLLLPDAGQQQTRLRLTAWEPPELPAVVPTELAEMATKEVPLSREGKSAVGEPPVRGADAGVPPKDEKELFARRARALEADGNLIEAAVCFSLAALPEAAARCYEAAARQLDESS